MRYIYKQKHISAVFLGQIEKMFEKNKRHEKHENTTKKIGQSVFSRNSGKPPQHLRLKPAGTHQQWAFCSYVPIVHTYNLYVVNMQILCNSIVTCQLIPLWTSHHFIIQATIASGARWVWTVNRLTQTKNSLDRQATWNATPEVAVDGSEIRPENHLGMYKNLGFLPSTVGISPCSIGNTSSSLVHFPLLR